MMENTYEKLQRTMNSYVPEFAYEHGGDDPGSVMTDLCGSMLEECRERYDRVLDKHYIQYLNLFESLLKEPVSASKGYVQFRPVTGYEGMILVPKGTRTMAEAPETGDVIFETEHSLTVTDANPVLAAVTDREEDRIVIHSCGPEERSPFTAFSVRGENRAEHRLYLCFDSLFDEVRSPELKIYVRAVSEGEQEALLDFLVSDQLRWSMLETGGKEKALPDVKKEEGHIAVRMDDYMPGKTTVGQKECYCLILTCTGQMPDLYVDTVSVAFEKDNVIPEEVYVNGVEENAGAFYPFGKPMGLYSGFAFDDPEVLSRKGAKVQIRFRLDYRVHEEILEMPEIDTEYKAIMKKPKKPLSIRPAEVVADYVCWEYLSVTGWKRLFKEEHLNALFNGSREGEVTLEFVCPSDMVDYDAGRREGRIRARLLQAENIYRMPAVYRCPFVSALNLAYSYADEKQGADYALSKNNFDERDVTKDLRYGGNTNLFCHTEHGKRTMYLGFDAPVSGTPFSLYFDIENYSDRPVDFQVEYWSDHGFAPVRVSDYTGGFCGSGNMLLVIPGDMARRSMFGKEGYFLRFIDYNKENPEYALPVIRGIYPNMAKVVNVNTVTEEFYLDSMEEALDIQLSQQNLLRASVEILEDTEEGRRWVSWKRAQRAYEGGRTFQLDMADGVLHFRKNTFVNFRIPEEGPQIRVHHCNYTGTKANLPAGSIKVLGSAIRYISSVNNPFPTYGGYDGYTEESVKRLAGGMLRTRNRAVTNRDLFDIIFQVSYGVRKVKCCNHTDAEGKDRPGCVTIAVLIEEYEKGAHVFSEIKKAIRERLMRDSSLIPLGKELVLIQPHFIRFSVRVWLEKEGIDHAYDLQQRAQDLIREFLDPLKGGMGGDGWEIGEMPRTSQVTARLRAGIVGCSVSRIVMTAYVEGKEVPVNEEFYGRMQDPFLMAVNGDHMVYIEVSEC